MKRILIVLTLLCFSLLCGCSMHYGESTIDKDNITFYPSRVNKVCFAGKYYWDSNFGNTIINIPDKVDGYKVTKLGGYTGRGVPTPFWIDFSKLGSYTIDIPENAEITIYNLS